MRRESCTCRSRCPSGGSVTARVGRVPQCRDGSLADACNQLRSRTTPARKPNSCQNSSCTTQPTADGRKGGPVQTLTAPWRGAPRVRRPGPRSCDSHGAVSAPRLSPTRCMTTFDCIVHLCMSFCICSFASTCWVASRSCTRSVQFSRLNTQGGVLFHYVHESLQPFCTPQRVSGTSGGRIDRGGVSGDAAV